MNTNPIIDCVFPFRREYSSPLLQTMHRLVSFLFLVFFLSAAPPVEAEVVTPAWPAAGAQAAQYAAFPRPLPAYESHAGIGVMDQLKARVQQEPFNLAAFIIFVCAILHTFAAGMISSYAHRVEVRHAETIAALGGGGEYEGQPASPPVRAGMLHVLGEVEVIFALWTIPLLLCGFVCYSWKDVEKFVSHDCSFAEPLFVVAVMAISATRPILRLAEQGLSHVAARLGKGSPAAWWMTVLTFAPLLGSVITEPAAMTIGAMLLARKFYELQPSRLFAFATLGLLFVNVSIGGVLTNFAAPPVLMVAKTWGWSSGYMATHFGYKAVAAIILSNVIYFLIFMRSFKKMGDPQDAVAGGQLHWKDRPEGIPWWITLVHVGFLAWTVYTCHYPALCLGGFLFFLGFVQATALHQNPVTIRGPLLVGLFLAGLVLHGRCQSWWLEPVLASGLGEFKLMLGATILTGFNDNALITLLASQVPGLTDSLKHAVMAGAVIGGGLTVIANAPNPAGQGLLKSYFGGHVSPLGLFLGALVPTGIAMACFWYL